MKIWSGFGSEHSMNLVMIGRFEDARDTEAAKLLIDRLTALVDEEQAAGQLVVGEPQGRFSDKVLDFLSTNNFVILGPDELAFLKVLIDHRARVEVFSAHFHETDKSAGG
jgi:Family of unknown function (DUF6375)